MRNALTLILVLAAAGGGWYFGTRFTDRQQDTGQLPKTVAEPVETRLRPAIRGIGKLEPASGILKIMAPVGHRIESLYDLEIGSSVAVDQPVVMLAGRKQAELELQIALAKKADAEKQESIEKAQGQWQRQAADLALQEARSRRAELETRSRGIVLLQSQLAKAKEMLQSLQRLKSDPATQRLVGKADIDKQQLVVEQLETQIVQAEDEIQQAQEKIQRAEQAAQIDLNRMDAVLNESTLPEQSINAAIDAAQEAIDMLQIRSPINGSVLDIVVRPGDTATNQPVMLIGDVSRMVCIAEINDSSLIDVQVGAAATMTSSALTEPLTGKVISKGLMIGPPSMKDPNPFASVDRKTGRVVIALDEAEIAAKFVNLQVDVAIEPEQTSN